jgi:hypothetical protein
MITSRFPGSVSCGRGVDNSDAAIASDKTLASTWLSNTCVVIAVSASRNARRNSGHDKAAARNVWHSREHHSHELDRQFLDGNRPEHSVLAHGECRGLGRNYVERSNMRDRVNSAPRSFSWPLSPIQSRNSPCLSCHLFDSQVGGNPCTTSNPSPDARLCYQHSVGRRLSHAAGPGPGSLQPSPRY